MREEEAAHPLPPPVPRWTAACERAGRREGVMNERGLHPPFGEPLPSLKFASCECATFDMRKHAASVR